MRVVITSIGSYGDLNPYIGLGIALAKRGHQPVLAVARAYQLKVEAAGLECRPVRPDTDLDNKEVVARIMDPMRGPEFIVRKLLMPRLREAYDDLLAATIDADAIVSHPLTFTAPLIAEQRGLPWAGSVLAPMSFFSRADPPLVVPDPIIAAAHRRWAVVSKALVSGGRLLTQPWGRPVQKLRRETGLPPGGHPLYAGQFSPRLNLAMFSSVLATPQPDWPPHVVVTGAVTYDAIHGGMPDDLRRFLDSGPAPVVFTLGSAAVSSVDAPRFYEQGATAAKARGLRSVLLVGRSPVNRPASLPADAFVTEWAPHSALFSRAAAVVHQGGAGTLHTALASGRPMIIVPFAHDQADNAARTEKLGIARVIYPRQFRAARVSAALEQLLGDRDVLARSESVAARVRAEHGGETAAKAIEGLR